MAENRLIYGILIDVLGRPKRKNESKQQFAFDAYDRDWETNFK